MTPCRTRLAEHPARSTASRRIWALARPTSAPKRNGRRAACWPRSWRSTSARSTCWCCINQWYRLLLRRAAEQGPGGLLAQMVRFCCIAFGFIVDRGLQVLPDAAAGAALARLDDAQLPAALDGRPAPSTGWSWRATPAASGRRPDNPDQRIQEDLQLFTDYTRDAVDGPAQRGGHAGELHRHPVGPVGRLLVHAAAAAATTIPGFMVWAGAGLLRRRQRHHALHRPAADRR